MFRPLELYVGLRYTRAKRRNHFISFISLSSMLGIALGVTALITVLSVMNGFERELRERILGMASHATISGTGGTLSGWRALIDRARAHPDVVGIAPYVQAEAMLNRGGAVRGALIRGVMPELEPEVSEIDRFMLEGSMSSLRPGEFNVLLGIGLANALGARVGRRPRSRRQASCRGCAVSPSAGSSAWITVSSIRRSRSLIWTTRRNYSS
jgi:lipoprotein-releasing system permease protein